MHKRTQCQTTAKLFFALGHLRRPKIFDILARHRHGMTFEDLSATSRIPNGSPAHHLNALKQASTISVTFNSRNKLCKLQPVDIEAALRATLQTKPDPAKPVRRECALAAACP